METQHQIATVTALHHHVGSETEQWCTETGVRNTVGKITWINKEFKVVDTTALSKNSLITMFINWGIATFRGLLNSISYGMYPARPLPRPQALLTFMFKIKRGPGAEATQT